jgi:hypothetical protein
MRQDAMQNEGSPTTGSSEKKAKNIMSYLKRLRGILHL